MFQSIKQPENEVFQLIKSTGDVVEEPGPSTQHGKFRACFIQS